MKGGGPVFETTPGWGGQLRAWLSKNLLYVIPAAAVIVILIVIWSLSGKNNSDLTATASNSAMPSISATELPSLATMEVKRGDSYTSIARRSVTMVILTLSAPGTNGQRLYAETKLVSDLKKQPLVAGGTITVSTDSIHTYLDEYGKLIPGQTAQWERWAKTIPF